MRVGRPVGVRLDPGDGLADLAPAVRTRAIDHASLILHAGRLTAVLVPGLQAAAHHAGRQSRGHAVGRDPAPGNAVRGQHRTAADPAPPQYRDFRSHPDIRTDPDGGLHDSLILDRYGDVLGDVVEVADVD